MVQAARDGYDVVVIGSGMAGLTAAALLAKAGRKVLVAEAGQQPGGCLQGFQWGPYRFDSSVHLVPGCGRGAGGHVDAILAALGVREQCRFVRADPMCTLVYPGLRLALPGQRDAHLDALARQFPHQAKGFRRLMDRCSTMARECLRMPPPWSYWQVLGRWWRRPRLLSDLRATVSEVTRQYVEDPRARTVAESLSIYAGLPSSKLSFALWGTLLASFLEQGAFYCLGTFQQIADALVKALRDRGGELLLGAKARQILVERRKACGVVLADGTQIRAATVISNADATQTYERLVGPQHLPGRLLRTVRRMRPALTGFRVYLGTDFDLRQAGWGYETIIFPHWDHERTFDTIRAARFESLLVTVPSLIDPTLAPPGEHVVRISSLAPYLIHDSWESERGRFLETVLAQIQRYLPGIHRHVRHVETLSPWDWERRTSNREGAIVGWALTPDQIGPGRLPQRTPIEGLYLSSHWARPGAGVVGSAIAGLQTVQQILGYRRPEQLGVVLDPA